MNLKEIPIGMKNYVKGISDKAESLAHQLPLPCLYPNCSGSPVGCHSQQCNGTLSVIANSEGMVIVPSKDAKGSISRTLDGVKVPRGFYPVHINQATKFNGFCKKHDNDLFAPIEKRSFVMDDGEQVLAFHRRAVALEIRGCLELLGYFKLEKYMLEQSNISTKNMDDEIYRAKERLSTIMFYEWNPLWYDNPQNSFHHAWRILPQRLPISLASIITPVFNEYLYVLYGEALNELGCKVMPRIGFTLTIVPQEEETHVIMIWNRILDSVVRVYRDRLMSSNNPEVEIFLNECIFCLSEDWCMNPDFWAAIPQHIKNELKQKLSMGMYERVKSIPHIITL